MKKVFETREVPHIWAHQQQDEGRNAAQNLYFNGLTIFSYGSHFPIASIFPDQSVILFTSHSYSNTTAKHKSFVLQAIPDHIYKVFTVPDVENSKWNKFDHSKNLAHFLNSIKEMIKKHINAMKYNYITDINTLLNDVREYITLFNLSDSLTDEQKIIFALTDISTSGMIDEAKDQQRTARKIAKTKKIEDNIKAMDHLTKWQNNEVDSFIYYSFTSAYLRITPDGQHIETTKGVKVTIKAARLLWAMIKAGKDIKGHTIDNYTVISINGSLKIGCHEIPIEEVKRIGTLLDIG